MTTTTLGPAVRRPAASAPAVPAPVRRPLAGLAGALFRAAFLASSSPDLDAAGVLRTAEADRRRVT